ncbi:BTB/POZ domain-containing protein 3-like [Contarinia nasturtii]|uniref:BTB/POZ domain-containing protein 3-like n=1 Tax=Contarinia nasturtii TaxID=265458 RepID=UPI0012D480B8|nr:BTB/POZ domain-containing protein 3-like [Contarinia nasturtii]XP_031637185.1 BTB/POZ domain-containing protein 3-like [Contarinia nasturtii]
MLPSNQVSNYYGINGIQTIGEDLYLNKKWADFHFEFESDERIPTHKSFLGTISDVFEAMFNDSWKEKTSVKIVDASIDEFKEFLQFFYLSRAQLTKENVAKVMYLADKYNVQECLRMCKQFMTLLLSTDNVCWGYDLAILYNQEFLKKYCETIIAIDTKAVFSSDSFLECSKDAVTNILQMDALSCSETEVFESCMAWLKLASQQDELTKEIVQKYLGDSFYKIRFGSMTLEEFTSFDPSYEELFSFGEYRKFIKKIASKNTDTEDEIPRKKFGKSSIDSCQKKRCARLISLKYSRQLYHIKNREITKFSVNEPILLCGFKCDKIWVSVDGNYGSVKENLPTKVTISEISKLSNEESILHGENVSIGPNIYLEVTLVKPILIRPGFMYAIHMEMSPPENTCTGVLLKSEVKLDSGITIQFHDDPTIDNTARGLIYELLFKQI